MKLVGGKVKRTRETALAFLFMFVAILVLPIEKLE